MKEYKNNPLASDSDDEKKMMKVEAGASRKLKQWRFERGRRSRGSSCTNKDIQYLQPQRRLDNYNSAMSYRRSQIHEGQETRTLLSVW